MKTDGKVPWLLLAVVGWTAILIPCHTLAQEGKIDLSLRLVSNGYYNEVLPGEDNVFFLEVRNTGRIAITGIRLYADKPNGWIIEFKPDSIDYLSPGSTQTVDVNIKPASDTGKGRYRVAIIAEANETRTVMGIRARVETATSIWLWVGVAAAALVVAGFIIIYLRFGRQ